jgi:hypothetical protein
VIPANIRQDIVERTDGIPLFVEEMTKAVLEAESEGAAEHAVATFPSPTRQSHQTIFVTELADFLNDLTVSFTTGSGRTTVRVSLTRRADNDTASVVNRLESVWLAYHQLDHEQTTKFGLRKSSMLGGRLVLYNEAARQRRARG